MKDCKNLNDFDIFVEQKNQLLIIDFWRPTCGPCRMLSPVLENISMVRPDIKGLKINTEEFEKLALDFQVNVVPTVFFIYNKKVVGKFVGFNSQEDIEDYIKDIEKSLK